jgi:hypothetical protein
MRTAQETLLVGNRNDVTRGQLVCPGICGITFFWDSNLPNQMKDTVFIVVLDLPTHGQALPYAAKPQWLGILR